MGRKLHYLTSAHRNLELIKLKSNLFKSVYFSIVKNEKLFMTELYTHILHIIYLLYVPLTYN